MTTRFSVALATAATLLLSTVAGGDELDPETDLVIAPGFDLVKANCTACHSSRQVLQMRADRDGWTELIRWMQRTQNLWLFPPSVETQIVDYLATHYGWAERTFRRKPLDPSLLPPAE